VCSGLPWPQADEAAGVGRVSKKRDPPKWEGVRKSSGKRLALTLRQDREQLMVLTEDGKYVMCQRIDVCGAMANC
jgi:hypothetical protein